MNPNTNYKTHHRAGNRNDSCKPGTGEYIASIIFNLIFLWIVNHLRDWHLPFIRDNFTVVLWILNLSILVKIAGDAVMLMAGLPVIRRLVRIITESASFVVQIVLYYIYPFDFSHIHGYQWVDRVLPILLIIGMVVSAMKVFSNLWKLIFSRD